MSAVYSGFRCRLARVRYDGFRREFTSGRVLNRGRRLPGRVETIGPDEEGGAQSKF